MISTFNYKFLCVRGGIPPRFTHLVMSYLGEKEKKIFKKEKKSDKSV